MANGSHQSIFQENLINEQGNKPITLLVKNIIPQELIPNWSKEEPPLTGELHAADCANLSLNRIHGLIDFGEIELSGVIGSKWLNITMGATNSAPANDKYIFTWHYHPDGNHAFSAQDWLTFIFSESLLSCLFTTKTVSLFIRGKKENRLHFIDECAKARLDFRNQPNLSFMRAIKLFSKLHGIDLTSADDNAIADKLSVSMHRWAI